MDIDDGVKYVGLKGHVYCSVSRQFKIKHIVNCYQNNTHHKLQLDYIVCLSILQCNSKT